MMVGRPPFTGKDYLEVIFQHLKEAPPLFASSRSIDTDANSTLALDISVEGEAKPKDKRTLWIALAFVAFVALGFMVVLFATRPPNRRAALAAKAPPPAASPARPEAPAPAQAEAAAQVRFHVNSEPKGAHVWLGRKDLGVTPLVFTVPAGPDGTVTKEIVFTLDGYYPLNLVAGGSHDVVLMQSLQKRPRARVSSRPLEPVAPTLELPAPEPVPAPANGPQSVAAAPAPPVGGAVVSALGEKSPAPAQATPVKAANPGPPPVTVLPFGDGMTPPALENEGQPIRYTREALAAKVEGSMIVKCLITTAGEVHNCRVIKAVPLMRDAVVESLQSRKYAPITYQGKPVAVDYVFNIRLVLPHH
jgi:serine/threonine-protein kinase